MRIGSDQLALALVALLALALMGVPYFVGTDEDSGAVRGVVVDARGFGIADAAVFLFSEERKQLVEETRSEAGGDFAFQLEPERPRVFVRPPAGKGLLPAWGPSSEDVAGLQAFVLRPARRIEVEVVDPAGAPVPGAEVRVYEHRDEAAVIALAVTDSEGRAVLSAPAVADVAAFAPGSGLARWRFEHAVPEEGDALRFTLPPATRVAGVVRDEAGPLAGIWLVAWEEGLEDGFNGFATSDRDGRFELPFGAAPTLVRALDPAGAHLTTRARFEAPPTAPLSLALERGAPLVVRLERKGLPISARVWSWSPANETWSSATRTSALGRAIVPVAARFGVRAEPLDPAYATLEAWDVEYDGSTLRLEASARP